MTTSECKDNYETVNKTRLTHIFSYVLSLNYNNFSGKVFSVPPCLRGNNGFTASQPHTPHAAIRLFPDAAGRS